MNQENDERGCGLADECYANLSCDGYKALYGK